MDAMKCAHCPSAAKICRVESGTGPGWCPTLEGGDGRREPDREYSDPGTLEFARAASVQEGECYGGRDRVPFVFHPVKSRLEELIEFARRMGYARLGLAFCGGLSREAAALAAILEKQRFEVVSVVCKVGGVPKESIGVRQEEKIRIGEFETMCNPIRQAKLLNGAKTDFNVMLGLCVGHDALFLRHVEALTTVFAVKDRVTGHNPLAAVYTSDSYYRRLVSTE